MNFDFWHDKKVFLTGHTGFKGAWLALWLQQLGAKVTGFALEPATNPNLFELAQVAKGMHSIIEDIRNAEKLADALYRSEAEVVIHMAAQPLVRESYVDPVNTYSTNVMGTVHLLEAVRQTPTVRAVVNVTTDKCYENREWVWGYRENEPMGGYDPYSSSKGCSELVTAAYRNSFFPPQKYAEHGVALASARAGNVIGGGDWAKDRLIPDIIAAFVASMPVRIRNPHAIRPWQHVLEPLRGYLMLAENLYLNGTSFAEAWNFGPHADDTHSVEWITHELAKQWGHGAEWEVSTGEQPHEATYLKLDISKASSRLHWKPVLRLNNALELIIEWARAHHNNEDLRGLTLNQIENYQSIVTRNVEHCF